MEIALITYADVPELSVDDELLVEPLRALGLQAVPVAWSDPDVRWERFALGVVRSTWDYFYKPKPFLAWLEAIEGRLPLWNPVPVLRWNAHKSYLRDLQARGVPVTPTEFVESRGSLHEIASSRGWDDVVVKPAISGAGRLTARFGAADFSGAGQVHLEQVLEEGMALVQPFLPALAEDGERSYIFVDGKFSHAVSRLPTMGAADGVIPDGEPMAPNPAEHALSARIVEAVGAEMLYARVDLANGTDGAPVLQELELIEPRLFFRQGAPEAAARMARAIARRARGSET